MAEAEKPQYIRSKDVESRASTGQKLLWRLETFGFDLIYWWPFTLLGMERAARFGGWLFGVIGPRLSQHKTALKNLKLAFPDMDAATHQKIAKQSWVNIGYTAGEFPHLPKLKPYEADRIEFEGMEHLDAIAESGKGAVFVSGHFANWEILAAAVSHHPVIDCVITYRAINNPHIDKRISDLRLGYGTKVLTPKGLGTREIMRALSKGQSVALMNDQKFREGIPVTFFGTEAMTAPGPTRMAIKYKLPLVYAQAVRTAPAHFKIIIHPPYTPPDTGDLATDMRAGVEWVTAKVENSVRTYPEQWFWQHKRWPKEAWELIAD